MRITILAVLVGMTLLPTVGLAHDGRSWDRGDRGEYRPIRGAQPGDPGYYCHRHKKKTNLNNNRKHCHSIYNDEHNPDSWRDYRDYSERSRRGSRLGWFGN